MSTNEAGPNLELEKENLEQQRVILRIWASYISGGSSGVGHVSLEHEFNGQTYYVSFWSKDVKIHNVLIPSAFKLPQDHTEDIELEKRDPEYTFCFYTLEKEGIFNEYNRFYEKLNKGNWNGWCLMGPIWTKLESTTENCASLALRLLVAGGLGDLISSAEVTSVVSKETGVATVKAVTESSKLNAGKAGKASVLSAENAAYIFVASPDVLKNILVKAKANELRKNPLTADIDFPNETKVKSKNTDRTWRDFFVNCCIQ